MVSSIGTAVPGLLGIFALALNLSLLLIILLPAMVLVLFFSASVAACHCVRGHGHKNAARMTEFANTRVDESTAALRKLQSKIISRIFADFSPSSSTSTSR
jgi:predicted small secreted protein